MENAELESSSDGEDIHERLPLFFALLNETLHLEEEFTSKDNLSQNIRRIERLKGGSYHNLSHASDDNLQEPYDDVKETPKPTENSPVMFSDLGWEPEYKDLWPIRVGDFSPLSPDAELLERGGRIGLDFWRWHREIAPLGYTPPLCTCKRTTGAREMLKRYAVGAISAPEKLVCENDVCRGLLYLPHSLIEVPLNRKISNASEFVMEVKIPDETDVYCGNMKHTIVVCTTSPQHERACLKAIDKSDISGALVYSVNRSGFLPYFRKYVPEKVMEELMSVEPIDSDISDSTDEYGFGEIFALKMHRGKLVVHKYNTASKVIMPLEPAMMCSWMGVDNPSPKDMPKAVAVTSIQDYTLCELIESFSNERRPLTFTLRGNNGPSQQEDINELFTGKGIKRKASSSLEDLVMPSDLALQASHIMKLTGTLRKI